MAKDGYIKLSDFLNDMEQTKTSNAMYEIGYKKGRADERKKVIEKIRELKQHTGKGHFCTKEYCPYHEDVDCFDCMDAILNYVERGGKTE